MAILPLIFALLLGVSAGRGAELATGAEIRFVPPGHGTVSIGIYDNNGTLIRVLCDEWTFNRFHVGLNALSTVWDGKDNAGVPVAPGTYHARGFLVGDIEVSGEALHFNDWIEGNDSPRLAEVLALQLLSGGDMLVAARLAGDREALLRYSPDGTVRWSNISDSVPAGAISLAASSTLAFHLRDGKLRCFNLEDGAEVALPFPVDGITSVAARDDRLALLGGESVVFYRLPAFASQGEAKDLPAGLVQLALLDQGTLAAAADGTLWRWQAGWSPMELAEGLTVRGLASGRGETFWILEDQGGREGVAQYSPEEGRLAEWHPADGEGRLRSITGDTKEDYFAALLENEGTQRTAAIRRRAGTDGWEFVFDKKITRCADFGWTGTELSPVAGTRPLEFTVQLGENPLDPAAPRAMVLRASHDKTGAGLSSSDGLPLFRVVEGGSVSAVMAVSTGPDSARFFAGDGTCVEEYALGALGTIVPLDAGSIVMGETGEVKTPSEEPAEGSEP